MSMLRNRFTLPLIVLLSLFFLVPAVVAQDSGSVSETLFVTFIPNVQFSPLYVAVEKGYFSQAGIDLTLEHSVDEPVGVELIAAGERRFGIVSGEQVIMARATGNRPVVFVYEWFQKFPVGIVAPADSGIDSVADLRGRKVGIPGRFGASYSGLVALLSAFDMTESDIQLEPIGFNAPEVVCLGGVEASVVYINNEPLQIEQRCTDVTIIPVASAVDLVSNGLVTNEETIASNPDLVRSMVWAFDQGLRSVINNPAEAYLLSAEYVENLPLDDDLRAALEEAAASQSDFLADAPDREAIADSRAALWESLSSRFDGETLLQFQVLLATIDLWDAERLGYSDLESWEVTQDTLMSMGFISEPIDLTAAFTNDFLPPVPAAE